MKAVFGRCGIALVATVAMAAYAAKPEPPLLQATIAALDTSVFDAYNHCADPVQLQAQYERDYAAAQAKAEADAKAAESRRVGSVPMPTYAPSNTGPAPQITGSDPYATPVQPTSRRNALA